MEDLKYFKKVLKDFEKEIKEMQKAKTSELVSAHSRARRGISRSQERVG